MDTALHLCGPVLSFAVIPRVDIHGLKQNCFLVLGGRGHILTGLEPSFLVTPSYPNLAKNTKCCQKSDFNQAT